jgi:predicted aldo/keto reductase-like oxidoreductase
LKRADDDLRDRVDQMRALEDQLNKLQEDYTDLRQVRASAYE